uniref:Uncharacterized protein n=1 Tax=Anguilla anguilla TaxID=7936 RepID=A0A0E9V1E2_ANGAN
MPCSQSWLMNLQYMCEISGGYNIFKWLGKGC